MSSLRKQEREAGQRARLMTREHERQQAAELVSIWLCTGVRTSAGAEPGPVQVPRAEAARLVADRLAV